MFYVKNLPWWERTLRIGAGLVAAAYAGLNLDGYARWGVMACGLGIALTGFFGFFPACALAGRRLEKNARKIRS